MGRNKLIILVLGCAAVLISCGKQETQQVNKKITASANEADAMAKKIYGEGVSILLRGDINSNGKPDALAAVIHKQLDEMKFWIQKGGVLEKSDEGWKLVLRFDEDVSSAKGKLTEIPESPYGYILSFKMDQNPVTLTVSASGAGGQPVSGESVLIWDALGNTYEVRETGSDKKSP